MTAENVQWLRGEHIYVCWRSLTLWKTFDSRIRFRLPWKKCNAWIMDSDLVLESTFTLIDIGAWQHIEPERPCPVHDMKVSMSVP